MRKAKTDPGNMDQKREQLENEIPVKKSNSIYVYMRRPEKKMQLVETIVVQMIFSMIIIKAKVVHILSIVIQRSIVMYIYLLLYVRVYILIVNYIVELFVG